MVRNQVLDGLAHNLFNLKMWRVKNRFKVIDTSAILCCFEVTDFRWKRETYNYLRNFNVLEHMLKDAIHFSSLKPKGKTHKTLCICSGVVRKNVAKTRLAHEVAWQTHKAGEHTDFSTWERTQVNLIRVGQTITMARKGQRQKMWSKTWHIRKKHFFQVNTNVNGYLVISIDSVPSPNIWILHIIS